MRKRSKILGAILIVSILAIATIAFAGYGYRGYMMGPGYIDGHMMGPGYGHGYMMGPGYNGGHMMGPGYDNGYMMGPGYNGGHMMGPGYGNGYMMGPGYNGYDNLTQEQRAAVNAAQDKFYKETQDLRSQLNEKEYALHNEFIKNNPNKDKVVDLQKEISKLQAAINLKAVQHEIEVRKILPENVQGQNYGARAGGGNGYCW